jgi:hypothetical protein
MSKPGSGGRRSGGQRKVPKEIHFRMGRGMLRERRECLSVEGLAAALEWVNPWSLLVLKHQQAMSARTL